MLTDGDRQTDMTKIRVAFRNFVKVPKNKPGFSEHRITRYSCWEKCEPHTYTVWAHEARPPLAIPFLNIHFDSIHSCTHISCKWYISDTSTFS